MTNPLAPVSARVFASTSGQRGAAGRARRPFMLMATLLACAVVPLACTDTSTDPGVNPVLPLGEVEFAAELGIDTAQFRSQESVWIRDDVVGDSAAPAAARDRVVTLFYEGRTSGGVRFDGVTEEDGDPVSFLPGVQGPILGLRQGVIGMRAGGKRTVLVPPASGFGSVQLPGIPGNSWLVLALRVVEVEEGA